jgi:hypothetical protein
MLIFKLKRSWAVVAGACNPSMQKAEAGESLVQDQPGLYSKTLSQKKQPPRLDFDHMIKREHTREV